MSADHDYKNGGWKDKYIIFKRCTFCNETGWDGWIPPPGSEIPGQICQQCKGKGVIPVDPKAIYFVLRLDEDPHARAAAVAYAKSIEKENPHFAMDIRHKLEETCKLEMLE